MSTSRTRLVPVPRGPDRNGSRDSAAPEGGGAVGSSDAELMRVLHDEHARPLWGYVLGLTNGDTARAEDIVQETLLRAWRQPAILAQSDGSVRSWLFTVAKRVVIDEWRSARARREVVMQEPPDSAVADGTDSADTRALVVAALGRLSDEHRQVLVECHLRGSSVAEAALRLGIPAGTVKSRTHYALRAFKLAVDELGGAV